MPTNILSEEEINALLEEDEDSHPKHCFIDSVDMSNYIQLDSTLVVFERLQKVIFESLKIVLIYGNPGTGKSMLLHRLYNTLSEQSHNILLISSPIQSEKKLFQVISKKIFHYLPEEDVPRDFISLIEKISELQPFYNEENKPLILLDEAQLYPDEVLEKIRILSDTRAVKFIIVLHQIENENIFNKEHFKSRVWESIQLQNASPQELKIYIQKKILHRGLVDLAHQVDIKIAKKIHKYTNGNYRLSNKLLYTLFETYFPQEKENYKHVVVITEEKLDFQITSKQIEVTAIRLDLFKIRKEKNYRFPDQSDVNLAEKERKNYYLKQNIKIFGSIFGVVLFCAILYFSYIYGMEWFSKKDKIEYQVAQVTTSSFSENSVTPFREEEEKNQKNINSTTDDKIVFVYAEEQQPILEYNDLFDKEENHNDNPPQSSDEDRKILELFTPNNEENTTINKEANITEKIETIAKIEDNKTDLNRTSSQIIDLNVTEIELNQTVEKIENQEIKDKNISEIKSIDSNKTVQNKVSIKKISEILEQTYYFDDSLFIEPYLNQFSEVELKELIYTDKDDEKFKVSKNKEIQNLENRFYETNNIQVGLRVLEKHYNQRNLNEVFKFAIVLNEMNSTLKSPWIVVKAILKELNQTEEIERLNREFIKIDQ